MRIVICRTRTIGTLIAAFAIIAAFLPRSALKTLALRPSDYTTLTVAAFTIIATLATLAIATLTIIAAFATLTVAAFTMLETALTSGTEIIFSLLVTTLALLITALAMLVTTLATAVAIALWTSRLITCAMNARTLRTSLTSVVKTL